MSDSATKSVQTTITVNDDETDKIHVRCLRTCQTVTHIDKDEKSPDKINALLGFTPYSLIQEGAIKIYDIPKKNILRFGEEDEEDTYDVEVIRIPDLDSPEESVNELNDDDERNSDETADGGIVKSNIKKPEVKLYKIRGGKKTNEAETQTELMVAKHVLSEDEVPIINGNIAVQTSLTFVPDARDTVTNNAFEASGKASHAHMGSDGGSYGTAVSRLSIPKVVSTINASVSQTHRMMTEVMESTAKRLRETLSRMLGNDLFDDLSEEKFQDQEVQCYEFADHVNSGDCLGLAGRKVLCECDCVNAGGAAVPLLNEPRHLSASHDDCVCLAEMPEQNKTQYKSYSQPSLIMNMKREPHYCRCGPRSQSYALLKCAGFMADKTLTPLRSRKQDDRLLVDLDNEYADAYLEQLEQEQVGTQTDVYDLVVDVDDGGDDVVQLERCTCERNIEMPWNDITYMPYIKQPKEHKKPTAEFVDNATDLPSIKEPETNRFKQLGVVPITQKELQDITRELYDDQLVFEEADNYQVKDNILEEEYGEFRNDSRNAENAPKEDMQDEEDVDSVDRLPTPKPRRYLVYDPDCPKENEPYLDRMHKDFPDDCDELEICPSHIEMPWTNIILPNKPKIRKEYKPPEVKKEEGKKVIGKKEGKKCGKKCTQQAKQSKSALGIDIKLSFGEISSRLIPVENGAKDQISISTTISNLMYSPKRAEKSYIIKGSFSQPFLGQQQPSQSNKCMCNAKGSDVVRVLNFSEPKSATDKTPHKKPKMKQIASLPSINNSNKSSEREKPPCKQTDKIAELLNSCKKEMEPIKDGINKLRLRIRELNLPDIHSYQQEPAPGTSSSGAPFNYTASFSALAGPSQLPFNANMPPCWTPFVPYPCTLPPCWPYGLPTTKPYKPRQKKRKTCPCSHKDDTSSVTPSSTQYDTDDTSNQQDTMSEEVIRGHCSGTCGKNECAAKMKKKNEQKADEDFTCKSDDVGKKQTAAAVAVTNRTAQPPSIKPTVKESPKINEYPTITRVISIAEGSKFTVTSAMGVKGDTSVRSTNKEMNKPTNDVTNISKKESITTSSKDSRSIKTDRSKQSKVSKEISSDKPDPSIQSKVSKEISNKPDPSIQSKVSKESSSVKPSSFKQSKVSKENLCAKTIVLEKINKPSPDLQKKEYPPKPEPKICVCKSKIPIPICKCMQDKIKRGTIIKSSDSNTPSLTYVLQTVTVKDNKVQQANTVNIAFSRNPYKTPGVDKSSCTCQPAEKKTKNADKRTCIAEEVEEISESSEENSESSEDEEGGDVQCADKDGDGVCDTNGNHECE